MAAKQKRDENWRKLADLDGFRSEIETQNDISVAILSGAYLDLLLEQLLRTFLVIDGDIQDKLFAADRPLSTFSSRINIAYSLGLLTKSEYNDLNRVRHIRNEFAHSLHGLTFDEARIQDRCRSLEIPSLDIDITKLSGWGAFQDMTKQLIAGGVDVTITPIVSELFPPRQTFILTVPLLIRRLFTRMKKIENEGLRCSVCADELEQIVIHPPETP